MTQPKFTQSDIARMSATIIAYANQHADQSNAVADRSAIATQYHDEHASGLAACNQDNAEKLFDAAMAQMKAQGYLSNDARLVPSLMNPSKLGSVRAILGGQTGASFELRLDQPVLVQISHYGKDYAAYIGGPKSGAPEGDWMPVPGWTHMGYSVYVKKNELWFLKSVESQPVVKPNSHSNGLLESTIKRRVSSILQNLFPQEVIGGLSLSYEVTNQGKIANVHVAVENLKIGERSAFDNEKADVRNYITGLLQGDLPESMIGASVGVHELNSFRVVTQ